MKLHLTASMADTGQAASGLAAATDRLEQAIDRLRLVTLGSVHPQVAEAINRLEQARMQVQQAQSLVRGALDSAESDRATI